MQTRPIKGQEQTRLMICPEGHQIRVRVNSKGDLRGSGQLICPLCRSTDLRWQR